MKLTLRRAVVVEGRYDAARLANLVDGTILTTDGFAVFKDKAMQDLLKRTARAVGLILLTDSDAAGFRIRHFVTGLVGAECVCQAYVPAIQGKERRKAEPGKEGILGVEGVGDEWVLRALQTALRAAPEGGHENGRSAAARHITYTDLYEWGISGGHDSARKRRELLRRLGLPPRLSKRELLAVLNTLYTYESLSMSIAQI